MASGDTRVTDVGGLVFGLVPMTILPFDVIAYFLHKCYDGLSYCTSPHYRSIYTRIYFSGMCECVMFSSHVAFRPFLVELPLHVAEAVDLWLVALQSRWHASRQHSSSSWLASLENSSYDGVLDLPSVVV